MRGISHKELLKIDPWQHDNQQDLLNHILDQCKELNNWMTLDEFLRYGFEGKCWVFKIDQEIQFTEYYESIAGHRVFAGHAGSIPHNKIKKVWPIQKPETSK